MSERKAGPAIPDTITEVRGSFASHAALETAIAELEQAGFDRADLSLPTTGGSTGQATPEQGASAPLTHTDVRQARTLGASLAGSAAALAAAGATIATGGAAGVAIAAAAAAGLGTGVAVEATGQAAGSARHDAMEQAAADGALVLTVRTPTEQKRERAETILRNLGAGRVAPTTRADAGVDSAGWTG